MPHLNGTGWLYDPRRLRPQLIGVCGPAYDSIRFRCRDAPLTAASTIDQVPTVDVYDGGSWITATPTVERYSDANYMRIKLAGSPSMLRRPLPIAIEDYPFAGVRVTLPEGRYLNSHAGFVAPEFAIPTPTADPYEFAASSAQATPSMRQVVQWNQSAPGFLTLQGEFAEIIRRGPDEDRSGRIWIWFDNPVDKIDVTKWRYMVAGTPTAWPTAPESQPRLIPGSNGRLVSFVLFRINPITIRLLAGALTRNGIDSVQHDSTATNNRFIPLLGLRACPTASMFQRPHLADTGAGQFASDYNGQRKVPWLRDDGEDYIIRNNISTSNGSLSFPDGLPGIDSIDVPAYQGKPYNLPPGAVPWTTGRHSAEANIRTSHAWGGTFPAKVGVADGTIVTGSNVPGYRFTTLYSANGRPVPVPRKLPQTTNNLSIPPFDTWNPVRDQWGWYEPVSGAFGSTTTERTAVGGYWLLATPETLDGLTIFQPSDLAATTMRGINPYAIGVTGWLADEPVLFVEFEPWQRWRSVQLRTANKCDTAQVSPYPPASADILFGDNLTLPSGYEYFTDKNMVDNLYKSGPPDWETGTVSIYFVEPGHGGPSHFSSVYATGTVSYVSNAATAASTLPGIKSAVQSDVGGLSLMGEVFLKDTSVNPTLTTIESYNDGTIPIYRRSVGFVGFTSCGPAGSLSAYEVTVYDKDIYFIYWNPERSYETGETIRREFSETVGAIVYNYSLVFEAITTTTVGLAPELGSSEWIPGTGVVFGSLNYAIVVTIKARNTALAATSNAIYPRMLGYKLTASGLPAVNTALMEPGFGGEGKIVGSLAPNYTWPLPIPIKGKFAAYPGGIWEDEAILDP